MAILVNASERGPTKRRGANLDDIVTNNDGSMSFVLHPHHDPKLKVQLPAQRVELSRDEAAELLHALLPPSDASAPALDACPDCDEGETEDICGQCEGPVYKTCKACKGTGKRATNAGSEVKNEEFWLTPEQEALWETKGEAGDKIRDEIRAHAKRECGEGAPIEILDPEGGVWEVITFDPEPTRKGTGKRAPAESK